MFFNNPVSFLFTFTGECSSDVCKEPLCENGGTCVAQSADSHLCLCPLGFSGPACEQGNVA